MHTFSLSAYLTIHICKLPYLQSVSATLLGGWKTPDVLVNSPGAWFVNVGGLVSCARQGVVWYPTGPYQLPGLSPCLAACWPDPDGVLKARGNIHPLPRGEWR